LEQTDYQSGSVGFSAAEDRGENPETFGEEKSGWSQCLQHVIDSNKITPTYNNI